MLRNCEVIFIDFDGTLVDSLDLLYLAYCDFMKEHALEGTKEEFDYLNGKSSKEIFSYLQSKYYFDPACQTLAEKYQQLLIDLYASKAELFPDVRIFLQRAFKKGKRLVIVTSAKRKLVDLVLEKEQIGRYFEMIVSAEKLEHGKPDPEIYQQALNLVGVPSEQAVAIEDSINGLKAASSAGVATIAFNNPYSDGVQVHVNNWHELENLFCLEG